MTGKLMAHAFGGAFAAFVFGLCLGHTLLKHLDSVYSAGMLLAGAGFVFVLFWTHYVIKRVRVSEASRQSERQFLWSCVFFAMISTIFGLQVSGITWFSTDFLREFGFVFWGLMTLVAIFPVRRDAKRLARGVPSQAGSN
jgi:hypothetical protein